MSEIPECFLFKLATKREVDVLQRVAPRERHDCLSLLIVSEVDRCQEYGFIAPYCQETCHAFEILSCPDPRLPGACFVAWAKSSTPVLFGMYLEYGMTGILQFKN
jgi:hypothetical protein